MPFHPEKLLSSKRTKLFRIILIIIQIISFYYLDAQDSTIKSELPPIKNLITVSTVKLTNTLLFNGDALLDFDIFGGNLKIVQRYKGTTIKYYRDTTKIDSTIKDTVKYDTTYPRINYLNITDIEIFKMNYSHPIDDFLSIVAENNWIYGSYNNLSRLNGTAGLRFNTSAKSFLEFKGGLEKNNQIGVNYLGPIINLEGRLFDLLLEDYHINSSFNSEYIKLKNNRKNADIDFGLFIDKKFDEYDRIHFNVNYLMMFRDQLSFLRLESITSTPIESWFDSKIASNLNFNFGLFENFFGNIDFSVQNNWKNRYFQDYIPNYNITGINKKRETFGISFLGEIKYQTSKFKQIIGLLFSSGNDENKISKNYNINDVGFNYLKEIEKLFDYSENTTRLYLLTEWEPTFKDKINIETSVSLNQRDTPSEQDNTDGDLFSSLINFNYLHKFNNSLFLNLFADMDFYHQVYIKSKMSNDNKWRKYISLKSKISWFTSYFTMNPELEIFANYEDYDFVDSLSISNNRSSRQLSYRDSITIFLGKVLSLQSYINIRYNEKGIIFWENFSVLPTSIDFEKFFKIMLSGKFSDNYFAAVGLRYYSFALLSIAPEIDIKLFLLGQSYISLQGWYDFQNISKPDFRQIANFFLTTKIVL
ncbi:MAG: hypothetical protein M1419_02360 [Bacteroidetes bacterium]|nr:hypothetical protein [Bacteroidota bacterium]